MNETAHTSFAFLSGGGELGALVRAHEWSHTPLGPPQQWPPSLRMAVSTCLNCSFPIVIWWGRELTLIYNDAYISILAGKHPRALGRPGEECWQEVWSLVGPMLHRVLDEAKPFTADDLRLIVWRHGYFEECYFYFSYSPIYEDDGSVSGVFCPVIENTDKIIGARRLETLRELAALRRAESIQQACQQAIAVLAKNGRDVPFAYLYMLCDNGDSAALMAATDSTPAGAPLPLAQIVAWPLATALDRPQVLESLDGRHLPVGAWSEPPTQVYLAPVVLAGSQRTRAILVAGISPHKRLDESYRSFYELLVSQVGATLADTLAYEAERKRAEALRENEARLRSATEVGHLGLWDWTIPTGEIVWSDEHFRMEGYAVGEVIPSYKTWMARIHPDDRASAEAALRSAMDLREDYENEFRVIHPDGSTHWLYGRGRFYYDSAGQAVRMIGAMIDTTERREWEERQKVLFAELQHRTRNLLAVVRSITDRLLSRSASLQQFQASFRDRLDALARVNGLLSRLNEGDRITFNQLVATELAAHGLVQDNGYDGRVSLSGPETVRLRSAMVQTLALGLHELATNALKYGALSTPSGRLSITWSVESGAEPRLAVDWRESGVPIEHPPQHHGYGRELLEHALPYQLNAETTYRFTPEGVHCIVVLPLATLQI